VLSPQRLVHYRNTWYLDAWCHEAKELRRFALDAFEDAALLEDKARDVSLKTVQRELDAGYGAFVGRTAQWATLRFTPNVARWVSKEEWHPRQEAQWLAGGTYELRVPFADPLELAMDVMRLGADVEVFAPKSLREFVRKRLEAAVAAYETDAQR
jgi:predicted DNA-binding transcriptional regulator YafY